MKKWVPKHTLPTTPGLYYDKDGDVWALTPDGDGWQTADTGVFEFATEPIDYMPFEFIAPLKKSV